MFMVSLIVIWIASAILIWGLEAGFHYALGEEFNMLGTPKEQWENDGRRKAVVMSIFVSLMGPIGLIACIFAAFTAGYGLKFKFTWKG